MPENNYTTMIKEQCSDSEPTEIKVNILSEKGQIWIQPKGYGEKCAIDGEGHPIGIEIWQGKLRLILFNDINNEEAKIIDLENAKESRRHEYCQAVEYLAEQGRTIFTGCMIGGIWNGACLTACITSHKQDDKVAYEYLLKIADKYSPCLSDEQKQILQEIKSNATGFLKSSEPSDVVKKDQIDSSINQSGDTNSQELNMMDTEKHGKTELMRCNWCGKVIETEPIKWKGLPFCSEPCLDACRAVQ